VAFRVGTEPRRPGRTRFALAVGAAVVALATAQAAQAYQAFVTTPAPILTGPSPDYPPVVYLHGGEPVEVYGCLDDYDWCDVQFREFRGWFDAEQLTYAYEGQQVPLYDYGYDIGLPIISFSLNDYWGRYYRDRPFFRERDRWAHIPMPRPRDDHHRFDGGPGRGPGFDHGHGPDQGHAGFDRGPGPGRPDFDHNHGPDNHGPDQARAGFDRGPGPNPGPGGPGRPDFNRGQQGPNQQHGQQPPQQQQPRPQVQAAPAQAAHMQGPAEHQRYVGAGRPPQAAPQAGAPHPQAAPAAAPQAHQGGGGHPDGGHGDGHNQDNK
jgi:uncharacterized protein YraI